jgi:hypothetical protein
LKALAPGCRALRGVEIKCSDFKNYCKGRARRCCLLRNGLEDVSSESALLLNAIRFRRLLEIEKEMAWPRMTILNLLSVHFKAHSEPTTRNISRPATSQAISKRKLIPELNLYGPAQAPSRFLFQRAHDSSYSRHSAAGKLDHQFNRRTPVIQNCHF